MNPANIKYVIVTPVRDEEKHLPFTIESMLRQTMRPAEWVIVNDGSKDSTGSIIDKYASEYPWIHAVHREDRGFRKAGGGIIEAFYAGYNTLICQDWEYMGKLDGDLSFEPDYFEKCFVHFVAEPRLGIGGGFLYHITDGRKVLEECPIFHVRGGVKIYRRACWDMIGGLWVGLGSDTIDEVKANMLGWKTMSFTDVHLIHHRYTGLAYGRWGGIIKNGRSDYVCGYHPLFLLAKCLFRLIQRPYILGSLALLYGFITGYIRRIPQVDDKELIRYLRRQQLARLWGRETIWR